MATIAQVKSQIGLLKNDVKANAAVYTDKKLSILLEEVKRLRAVAITK